VNYLYHIGVYLGIYVITALSLNVVVGYCGMLTMAHAGYFAIGSYAYALASLKLGWGFLPSLALAAGVAGVLSLAVSLSAWRLRDDFFVLVSLSAQVLIFSLLFNWFTPNEEIGSFANFTNGPYGISSIPKPQLFGLRFESTGSMAILSLVLAAACTVLLRLLLSSPWGRLLKAIRDDELAARGLGKDTRLAKVQAFSVACGMVGLAGAVYASYVTYIEPGISSVNESVVMLCMVIVGGAGNFRGPIVGAVTLLAIPEILRFVDLSERLAGNLRLAAFGLLLVLMMHFRPQGLAGEYRID
jgi:branched-chain amino acid transport system permease protein